MRRNLELIACLFLIGITLALWAGALYGSTYERPQLWRNGYYPFTVEVSVHDR